MRRQTPRRLQSSGKILWPKIFPSQSTRLSDTPFPTIATISPTYFLNFVNSKSRLSSPAVFRQHLEALQLTFQSDKPISSIPSRSYK
jgi:hypothetical protein